MQTKIGKPYVNACLIEDDIFINKSDSIIAQKSILKTKKYDSRN